MIEKLGGRKFLFAIFAETLVFILVVVVIVVLKPTFDQLIVLLNSFMIFTGTNGATYVVGNVVGNKIDQTNPTINTEGEQG